MPHPVVPEVNPVPVHSTASLQQPIEGEKESLEPAATIWGNSFRFSEKF